MHALLLNIAGVNPALLYALTLLFYKNMASPTLSLDTVGDLKECCTVSLTPANATFNEDLLVSSKTNTTVTRDPRSLILAVCITALYSLICVVGLLGNLLVMYGVVR